MCVPSRDDEAEEEDDDEMNEVPLITLVSSLCCAVNQYLPILSRHGRPFVLFLRRVSRAGLTSSRVRIRWMRTVAVHFSIHLS